MLVFQAGMERKQMFLFRLVDVVNELFAMSASISRAIALQKRGAPEAAAAMEAADHFCKKSRRVVNERFGQLWGNDDDAKVAFSRQVLKGDHAWMEAMYDGVNGSDRDASDSKEEAAETRLAS